MNERIASSIYLWCYGVIGLDLVAQSLSQCNLLSIHPRPFASCCLCMTSRTESLLPKHRWCAAYHSHNFLILPTNSLGYHPEVLNPVFPCLSSPPNPSLGSQEQHRSPRRRSFDSLFSAQIRILSHDPAPKSCPLPPSRSITIA